MMPRLSEFYHHRLTDLPEDLDFSYLSKIGMGVGGYSLGRSRRRHVGSVGGYGRNGDKAMNDDRLGAKSTADSSSNVIEEILTMRIAATGKLDRYL